MAGAPRAPADTLGGPLVDPILEDASLAGVEATRHALLARVLTRWRYQRGWLLRPAPSAPFAHQLRHARLRAPLGTFLLAIVPLRMAATWAQGQLAVRGGAVLKHRLMAGALNSELDALRRQGIGQLFGRAVEAEAVEQLALTGSFAAAVAPLKLLAAAWVLAQGAGGGWLPWLLLAWVDLVLSLAWREWRRRRAWTSDRIEPSLPADGWEWGWRDWAWPSSGGRTRPPVWPSLSGGSCWPCAR